MNKGFTDQAGKYVMILTIMAAVFSFSLICASQASAAPDDSVATRLLGKPVTQVQEHLDSVRNRPSQQSDLAKTFDERDHYRSGTQAALGDGTTAMFFDLRRDIELENETWHGSAGLQISF